MHNRTIYGCILSSAAANPQFATDWMYTPSGVVYCDFGTENAFGDHNRPRMAITRPRLLQLPGAVRRLEQPPRAAAYRAIRARDRAGRRKTAEMPAACRSPGRESCRTAWDSGPPARPTPSAAKPARYVEQNFVVDARQCKWVGSRTRIMAASAPRRRARPEGRGRLQSRCRPRRPTNRPARRWCRSKRRTSPASRRPSPRGAR